MNTHINININSSLEQLENDIKLTKSEIKKSILTKLYELKLSEIEKKKAETKFNNMIKEKQEILKSIVNNDTNENEKIDKMWEFDDVTDPKYEKYQQNDTINNTLMDRLNNEIDFRLDPSNQPVTNYEPNTY